MASEEPTKLLQEYYLPDNEQDITSAVYKAFIMFAVFSILCISLVLYFS